METRQHTTGRGPADTRQPVTVRLFGGPTALIETGGPRLLTDPAFDAARTVIPVPPEVWQSRGEGTDTRREAFVRHGCRDRLLLLAPGRSSTLRPERPTVTPSPTRLRRSGPSRAPHPTEKHHA
ncbi:hypothetical protein [Streptomyces avermitilis]|uniref:hypothetical protein n=1 Tax=Streptomyces avermitilis TaxID=33903 RepID=UPI00371F2752